MRAQILVWSLCIYVGVAGIGCTSGDGHPGSPATGMTFNIRIGGQVVGRVTAVAGQPFTIAAHQLRADLQGSDAVVLRIGAGGGERTISAALGSVVAISPDDRLEIELVDSGGSPSSAPVAVSACALPADSDPAAIDRAGAVTACCVECGVVTACGHCVSMSCGECCKDSK